MTVKPKRATQAKNKSVRKKPAKDTNKKIDTIKFTAIIGALKVTSRSSNVTLAIPLSDNKAVSRLMESRLPDQYLEIVATIKKKVKKVKDGKKDDSRSRKRRRYPYKR
jgi:hypothetical protein